MGRARQQATTLYSVWRNSDDKLLILDGTAEECCKLLNINKNSFYRLACVSGKGYVGLYTVRKATRNQVLKEIDS